MVMAWVNIAVVNGIMRCSSNSGFQCLDLNVIPLKVKWNIINVITRIKHPCYVLLKCMHVS